MEKYRIIKCETGERGQKYHYFSVGEIVTRRYKDVFSNGKMQQILHSDEYELIKEETA